MIDRAAADIANAAELVALAPSRRTFVHSIALLAIAALPTLPAWAAGAPSTEDIVVVDGWILTSRDLH